MKRAKGEGSVEVSWERVDEGCVDLVLVEILLVGAGGDTADGCCYVET